MGWQVGASRDLPVINEGSWDGSAAQASIWKWAQKSDGSIDSSKAKKAFLIYDSANADKKGGYKLPFAKVVNGSLKASSAGIRAAASRLPQTDAPADVLNRAKAVVASYEKKMGIGKDKKNSDNEFNVRCQTPGEFNFDSKVVIDPKNIPQGYQTPPGGMPENCVEASIDMLRTGNFIRTSYFGNTMVKITPDMIDTMIQNFNDGVVDRGVPLDTNHQKDAAYGWLMSLDKKVKPVKGKDQTYLTGKWALNPQGQQMVKDGLYRLFSIEFNENYSDREVAGTTTGPSGDEQPMGDITYYGPTILGGALTNRPFIPNMDAVQFSEDQDDKVVISKICIMTESDEEEVKPEVKQVTQDVKATSGDQKKDVVSSFQSDNTTSKNKDEKSTNFSIVSGLKPIKEKPLDILELMESQLAKLDPNSQEYKDASEAIKQFKLEMVKKENDIKNLKELSDKQNAKFTSDFEKMAAKLVTLEEQAKDSASEIAMQKERARTAEINEYVSSLGRKGYSKPVQKKVKEILLADVAGKNIVTLSDSDKKDMPLNLRGVIDQILSVIPETARVDFSEKVKDDARETSDLEGDENSKFMEKHGATIDAVNKRTMSAATKRAKKDIKRESSNDVQ